MRRSCDFLLLSPDASCCCARVQIAQIANVQLLSLPAPWSELADLLVAIDWDRHQVGVELVLHNQRKTRKL